jgi:lysozyme
MVPQRAVDLAKHFEGFHRVVRVQPVPTAVPYVCPAGYWTIGYGELCQRDHPEITEPDAVLRLETVLLPAYVNHAVRLSPVLLTAGEPRLAAITDFVFNLGPTQYAASTLRKRIAVQDWDGAVEQILRWVWGGGRKLPGLIRRRQAEAELLVA